MLSPGQISKWPVFSLVVAISKAPRNGAVWGYGFRQEKRWSRIDILSTLKARRRFVASFVGRIISGLELREPLHADGMGLCDPVLEPGSIHLILDLAIPQSPEARWRIEGYFKAQFGRLFGGGLFFARSWFKAKTEAFGTGAPSKLVTAAAGAKIVLFATQPATVLRPLHRGAVCSATPWTTPSVIFCR